MELVSTSCVERLNATTRLHMRRLTLAFSKKVETFEAAVALHFAYYNLVSDTERCAALQRWKRGSSVTSGARAIWWKLQASRFSTFLYNVRERIWHMIEGEQFELVGRKRAQYRDGKKEFAALRARSVEWSDLAATISEGLRKPEMIRWWDRTPSIGRRQEHVVFTPKMFELLTENNIKQLCNDIKRIEAALASLRQELTAMDEDPER